MATVTKEGGGAIVKEAAAAAEAKAVVRSRRLSALVRDPEPLLEECHQRMEDLKQEAALSAAKVNHRRVMDVNLLRQLQSEFAFGAANPNEMGAQENFPRGKDSSDYSHLRRNAQPLSEIMPQAQCAPLNDRSDCRPPVIDRLKRQASLSSTTPRGQSENICQRANERRHTPQSRRFSNEASIEAICDERGARLPQQQTAPQSDAEATSRGGLLQRLTASGFEGSALTECIGCGGTDLLFDTLKDFEGNNTTLVRAELVGLLLILVAHGFPQTAGREEELLQELQGTLMNLYSAASFANVEDSDQFRELPMRLCEGCVCFTAHCELKVALCEAPETLQGVLEFMCDVDLSEPALAFTVASFLLNLCRGGQDLEALGCNLQVLTSGLRQDSLLGILYPDVLAAADPGPPELAGIFRAALCTPAEPGAAPLAITLLARCAESGAEAQCVAAQTLRLLCLAPEHRCTLASSSGLVGMLLDLATSLEAFRIGILQTLAQVCIAADPATIDPDDQLRAVAPLIQLMQLPDEQVQLDGAMGLTNLLTTRDEVRSLALESGAWSLCQELLFSESQNVRRAATEAMCNFTASPEVLEFCASGQGDLELQVFTSFCAAPDHGTQVAAAGALAMLAREPQVALRIATGPRSQRLCEVFTAAEDPDVQLRMVTCLHGLFHAEGIGKELQQLIWTAFAEKTQGAGFVSSDAETLAWSVLEES